MCTANVFLGLIAILFPPLPVWVKSGLCSADSLINILLCCLGWLPGLIHAWYIICVTPDDEYDYERIPDPERGGRVTYYFVTGPLAGHHHHQSQPQYGTSGQCGAAAPPQQPAAAAPNVDSAAGESASGSGDVPPPYVEAIRGDHKVQT